MLIRWLPSKVVECHQLTVHREMQAILLKLVDIVWVSSIVQHSTCTDYGLPNNQPACVLSARSAAAVRWLARATACTPSLSAFRKSPRHDGRTRASQPSTRPRSDITEIFCVPLHRRDGLSTMSVYLTRPRTRNHGESVCRHAANEEVSFRRHALTMSKSLTQTMNTGNRCIKAESRSLVRGAAGRISRHHKQKDTVSVPRFLR